MKTEYWNTNGFSLIELMVGMVISALALAGIYGAYRAQAGLYATQEVVANMQQNSRSAMYYMQRSIRMSGYDPAETDAMGFVANFDDPYDTLGATTDATHIAFTVDIDASGSVDGNDTEIVAFRLNSGNLQKIMIDGGGAASWQTIAENIDALNFVYLDGDNPPAALDPTVAANRPAIRSVQITLVAGAGANASPLAKNATDNITLTAQVNCRNMGLE